MVRGAALLRGGVEEAVRWASPVVHFMRYTTKDVNMAGVRIPRGEAVVAWIASANRDEHEFDEPYRFDVARQPNRHVAYGDGPHYCIGAAAAGATLRATFAEIFRTAHLQSNFTAGIKRMCRRRRRPRTALGSD